MAKYVCKNFGECNKAHTGEQIEVLPGMDPSCPECGSALVPVESGGKFDFLFQPGVKRGLGATAALIAALLLGDDAIRIINRIIVSSPPPEPPIPQTSGTRGTQSDSASGGPDRPYPSQREIDANRKRSEVALKNDMAKAAEDESRKAVAQEMIKTAIAYLDQNKLAAAEKELADAKERDPAEPLIYYNLGVLRIKQGKTDEALIAFEESFKNGFTAFDKMDQDKDLALLRKDRRFLELVKKYRSTNG